MTALTAFGEHGYESTSVATIAKNAKISKGLIYHYFESKETILKGIFDMMMAEGTRIMNESVERTPKEQLRFIIEQSLLFIRTQTNVMRFMISLSVQPSAMEELKTLIETEKAKSFKQFSDIFRALGYAHPEVEAYFTGALLDGVALAYMSTNDYPLDQIANKLFQQYEL